MNYKIEIEIEKSDEGKGIYAIRRVNDNGDDYVILIGDEKFMRTLSSALKEVGF